MKTKTFCQFLKENYTKKQISKINKMSKKIENKTFAEMTQTKKRIRTEVSFKSESDKKKFLKNLPLIKKQLKIK